MNRYKHVVMFVTSILAHQACADLCALDPFITVDTFPPIIKIVSNGTYMYALEAIAGFASIYSPATLCANFNAHASRFEIAGFFNQELQGIFCGNTCPGLDPHDKPAIRKQLKKYRANIFATQLPSAIKDTQQVWSTLCTQMDPRTLDIMLGTAAIKSYACNRANLPVPSGRPATQPYPSGYRLGNFYSLQASLAGGEARSSFNTSAALRAGCAKLPSAAGDLEDLRLPPQVFKQALGCTNSSYPIVTADDIHTGIEEHFGELFVQVLFLAGSSPAYRNLICSGYKSASGNLTNYNPEGIPLVGFQYAQVNTWMAKRCTAANV